jgi:hypothetical protein
MTPTEAYNLALPKFTQSQAAAAAKAAQEDLGRKSQEIQEFAKKVTAQQEATSLFILEIEAAIAKQAELGRMSVEHQLYDNQKIYNPKMEDLNPVNRIVADYFEEKGFTVSLGWTYIEHKLSGNDPDYGSGTISTKVYDGLQVSWNK